MVSDDDAVGRDDELGVAVCVSEGKSISASAELIFACIASLIFDEVADRKLPLSQVDRSWDGIFPLTLKVPSRILPSTEISSHRQDNKR
jgi:hypothetical protein